ncbi:uncharacterized protein LOC131721058 isoform X1 [Acipenser ruthenus]|uniref:uncharacterized protein LOC131721058 isoform X1 n=2 Tax=Acipenser ruthenus TaxID=7906 RepID=UPI00145BF606|nr:uncharacterized protein LOC131721058 isoform X1 [Acipenser ruthenus]
MHFQGVIPSRTSFIPGQARITRNHSAGLTHSQGNPHCYLQTHVLHPTLHQTRSGNEPSHLHRQIVSPAAHQQARSCYDSPQVQTHILVPAVHQTSCGTGNPPEQRRFLAPGVQQSRHQNSFMRMHTLTPVQTQVVTPTVHQSKPSQLQRQILAPATHQGSQAYTVASNIQGRARTQPPVYIPDHRSCNQTDMAYRSYMQNDPGQGQLPMTWSTGLPVSSMHTLMNCGCLQCVALRPPATCNYDCNNIALPRPVAWIPIEGPGSCSFPFPYGAHTEAGLSRSVPLHCPWSYPPPTVPQLRPAGVSRVVRHEPRAPSRQAQCCFESARRPVVKEDPLLAPNLQGLHDAKRASRAGRSGDVTSAKRLPDTPQEKNKRIKRLSTASLLPKTSYSPELCHTQCKVCAEPKPLTTTGQSSDNPGESTFKSLDSVKRKAASKSNQVAGGPYQVSPDKKIKIRSPLAQVIEHETIEVDYQQSLHKTSDGPKALPTTPELSPSSITDSLRAGTLPSLQDSGLEVEVTDNSSDEDPPGFVDKVGSELCWLLPRCPLPPQGLSGPYTCSACLATFRSMASLVFHIRYGRMKNGFSCLMLIRKSQRPKPKPTLITYLRKKIRLFKRMLKNKQKLRWDI